MIEAVETSKRKESRASCIWAVEKNVKGHEFYCCIVSEAERGWGVGENSEIYYVTFKGKVTPETIYFFNPPI